jgi:hypothetical protein
MSNLIRLIHGFMSLEDVVARWVAGGRPRSSLQIRYLDKSSIVVPGLSGKLQVKNQFIWDNFSTLQIHMHTFSNTVQTGNFLLEVARRSKVCIRMTRLWSDLSSVTAIQTQLHSSDDIFWTTTSTTLQKLLKVGDGTTQLGQGKNGQLR